MDPISGSERAVPQQLQAWWFEMKAACFRAQRWWREGFKMPPRHARGVELADAPVAGEGRAPLWTHHGAAEFPLTAGKVHNLRLAAACLHGVEIPADTVFSFWSQLGRTTRRRGFVDGRELREGCMIPSTGGGLCALSGLLYGAALDAGLEIVERHEHSRIIPGSMAEAGRDATVFWNYVDLRFKAPFAWRIECVLGASHLTVRIRKSAPGAVVKDAPREQIHAPQRAAATGDCLTCGMLSCFRHPAATSAHAPSLGHTSFLLDARWPEFESWCQRHHHAGDRWHLPLDGQRWSKPNYAWKVPADGHARCETWFTLMRSLRQRSLPAQGAARQRTLLGSDAALAARYARSLHHECRHVIVVQNLLPHLWQMGALGGRSFDVLANRLPMQVLEDRLDRAASVHPVSTTLSDFRADPGLALAEREALAAAARVITPHREIAGMFGARGLVLDWELPKAVRVEKSPSSPVKLFFPASALARKGIFEVAAALNGLNAELWVLGAASEGAAQPLQQVKWRRAAVAELTLCDAMVIPAWVEHQPRLALRALAAGLPVVASRACGLPEDHPLLHTMEEPDAAQLRATLLALFPALGERNACAAAV